MLSLSDQDDAPLVDPALLPGSGLSGDADAEAGPPNGPRIGAWREPEKFFRCARALAFAPNSQFLAVGAESGDVYVFELKSLRRVAVHGLGEFGKTESSWWTKAVSAQAGELAQEVQAVQVLAFSPDSKVLACGSAGSAVVLGEASKNFFPACALRAHSQAITGMDWSSDGLALQAVDRSGELLFFSVTPGALKRSAHNPHAVALRDTLWASQTCAVGWATLGVFDPARQGKDVLCVDRSGDGRLLAAGDENGFVSLFRYPANAPGCSRRIQVRILQHFYMKRNFTYLNLVGPRVPSDECAVSKTRRGPAERGWQRPLRVAGVRECVCVCFS